MQPPQPIGNRAKSGLGQFLLTSFARAAMLAALSLFALGYAIAPPTLVLLQHSYSTSVTTHAVYASSGSRCVVRENVIVSFGRHVASEARLMQCLVARFSVLEVTEPPTARRSVLF